MPNTHGLHQSRGIEPGGARAPREAPRWRWTTASVLSGAAVVALPHDAAAHDFRRDYGDGCCWCEYTDCVARPSHPDPRCQAGHAPTDCGAYFDLLNCFGVGCIGDAGCKPDIPTGSVAETANGIDDDCDGFVDDEQCDNVDNDGDGQIDEDIGSCLFRFLAVPLCWSGTQAEFEASAHAQFDFFVNSAGVGSCADNFFLEIAQISDVNLSCTGFDTKEACTSADVLGTLEDELAATRSLMNVDIAVAFTDKDICGRIAGQSNTSDFLWIERPTRFPEVFAHEVGHVLGLADEYCSQAAGADDARCNTGSPPAPPPPNFLGADLGCSPTEGACCSGCDDYSACCDGNQNDLGGRCIMSSAGRDDGPRDFCARCSSHMQAPPDPRSAESPTGQPPMSCSFAHTGDRPVMDLEFEVDAQGALSVGSFEVGVGRLGLGGRSSSGRYEIQVLNGGGNVLDATHFHAGFHSTELKVFGEDYSDIEYTRFARGFRAALPAGATGADAFVIRALKDGQLAGQTTLNGSPPTADAGADRLLECSSNGTTTAQLDGRLSSDPDGDVLHYFWTSATAAIAEPNSPTPSATFPLGANVVTLRVSDGLLMSAPDATTVTVVDTTPPAITPANGSLTVCLPRPQLVKIPFPTVHDACAPGTEQITGQVVRVSARVITPIALPASGEIELPPGTHTVRWEARDAAGNTSVLEQPIVVSVVESAACCAPSQVVLQGTEGLDVIAPFFGRAYCVLGKGGPDQVATPEQGDAVFGGAGSDNLSAGLGANLASAGDGIDVVTGAGSSLEAYGGAASDTLQALLTARAELWGGAGHDQLLGGLGPDRIMPGPGRDNVLAGGGDDVVVLFDVCEAEFGEVLDGGLGNDTLITPVPVSTLRAMGVIVTGFNTVLLDASRRYFSECF